MRRNLDNNICSWQVNSCITHSWKEYSIDFASMLEVVQYSHPFLMRNFSINIRLLKFLSVELESVYVIWKHDDFITSALVQIDEILTRQELIRIIDVQRLLCARCCFQILIIEERCHFAPNLYTLNSCQKSLFLKVKPISFIKFRSDKEVQVFNSFILSDKGSGQPELAMSFTRFNNSTEHFSWHDLHLVKNHKTPISILDHFKDFLGISWPFPLSRDHSICWDQNDSFFWLTLNVNWNLIFSISA